MPDNVDPETRRRTMRAVRATDTSPELLVRRRVHAAGHRYRLHDKRLPGKPDLVFRRYKLVVFVHGCFWHWHGCKRSRMPATNRDYWTAKIARNVARDERVQAELAAAGWQVRVIWECSLDEGIATLLAELDERRNEQRSPHSAS